MYPHITQFQTLDARRELALSARLAAPEQGSARRSLTLLGRRRRRRHSQVTSTA